MTNIDNTLDLSLTAPYADCLIFVLSWQNVCEGLAAFDR